MIKKKSYNGLLIFGVVFIMLGLALLTYSIASYFEIKLATDKIDFESIDNNNQIPTSDKYYKYLSIWDNLNQKLEKNKNLPIKNMSCAYLDYAQHNIKSMYKLIYKNSSEDSTRRSVVEGNIKSLSSMYKNYTNCKKTALYIDELNEMLNEIKNSEKTLYQDRLDTFINGGHDIERINSNSTIYDKNQQNDSPQDTYIDKSITTDPKFKQVQQYIEPNDKKNINNTEEENFYGNEQTIKLNFDETNNKY